MSLSHDNADLYDRLANHLTGRWPYTRPDTGLLHELNDNLPMLATGMPFEPHFHTRAVLISTASPIGQLTILTNTIVINPRDVIRLDHPPGITGELNASLEWINRTIALAAEHATARIDNHYRWKD